MKTTPRRIVVGISGASGAIYGVRLLEALRSTGGMESHLVMTPAAEITLRCEMGWEPKRAHELADRVYPVDALEAPISSGSFLTEGMVIAPCSVKTLAGIASGYADNLLLRAADVCLKERRKLLLLFRETPLHLGHIRRMAEVTEMGAIVMPPLPAFYEQPKTVDDIVNHTVGRVLDHFGIDAEWIRRWGEGS